MNYFVYIVTNFKNTVLYTGVTNNLERRIAEHQSEQLKGFTEKYHLTKLVFYEEFRNVEDAIAAEKKIKGWVRKKKIALIDSCNISWEDLSGKILR